MIESQVAVADRFNDTLIIFDWQELTESHSLHFKIFWVKQVYTPHPPTAEIVMKVYFISIPLYCFCLDFLYELLWSILYFFGCLHIPQKCVQKQILLEMSRSKTSSRSVATPPARFSFYFWRVPRHHHPTFNPCHTFARCNEAGGENSSVLFFFAENCKQRAKYPALQRSGIRGKNLRMGIIWGEKKHYKNQNSVLRSK